MQYLSKSGELSTHLAIASFGIGTLLLVSAKFLPLVPIVWIGLYYVVLAFAINGIVLLYLLYLFLIQPQHREYFAVKMLIMLANIPIAAFYLFLLTNIF